MTTLLISFLVFLIVVLVIAAIVAWILSNIPGVPAFASRIVWAIAGLFVLIWIVRHVLPSFAFN
jgi:hypothetical protein